MLSWEVGVEQRGVLFFLPFPEQVTSLLLGFMINLQELANPNGGTPSCIMRSLGESDLLQSGAFSYPLPTYLTFYPETGTGLAAYFIQHYKGPHEGFALPLDSPQYSKILFIKYLPTLFLENLSAQPTVMLNAP